MTLDVALTGINAASTELSTIANNIANASTTGFKKSGVAFTDIYARSTFGAQRNAPGEGVNVSRINQDFSQGGMEATGNNLDLAVEGLGMFQVTDQGTPMYTRDGSFGLDRNGFIVNAQGHRLNGYTTNENAQIEPVIGELKIEYSDLQPKITENVTLGMNLDSSAEVLPAFDVSDPSTFNYSASATVFDSLGSEQVATLYVHKDAPNAWSGFLYVDGQEVSQPGGEELLFNTSGALDTVNGTPDRNFSSILFTPASGAEPMALEFGIGEVTQYESAFGTNTLSQDGYSSGRLSNFDVDPTGVIFGRFSNGQSRTMGQVTLSNFANVQGMQPQGGNAWVKTFASGEPVVGVPGSASLGLIQSGSLEESNVDITEELVAMISAQRGFQASAQVISTDDQLTQTIMNLGR